MGQTIALEPEMTGSDWITVAPQHAGPDLGAGLMRIVAATKISPLQITSDFIRLAYGPGKISFNDYNKLKLFDRAFWADADRRQVVGQRRSISIWQTINFRHDWWGFFDNKLASGSYLASFGLPVIPNLTIYREGLNRHGAQVVSDKDQLRRFLQRDDIYPLFGKPADGLQSLGSVALHSYIADTDSVVTHDGHVIGLDAFIAEIAKHYSGGYLFQKLTLPHADIRALCGDRLATIRVVTLRLGSETPLIYRVCWKIPAGKNMADNFWRNGNLLVQLDPDTGEVKRALSGTSVDMVAHTHHPDTQMPLAGFRVPHWRALCDMVTEAARLMDQVSLIGWDVAVLADGPVIVEMNERPDFILPQLADGRGVLDAVLLDAMAAQKNNNAAYRRMLKQEAKQ